MAHALKARAQVVATQHTARARHGLVFPSPSGVAAALELVRGKGFKARDQQTRIAVGAQGGVNFVHIAFTGFHGQPIDEFAHHLAIDLAGALVVVVKHKHQVQIAAVAQLFAAQFAVGQDGQLGVGAVAGFQAAPAPAQGDAQHAVGQGAELVGHLFHRHHAFHVARQGAKHLGMLSPPQQVQHRLFIVVARGF